MSHSIAETFKQISKKKECALVPFITAGDPDLDVTEKALKILDEEGATMIELGLPYSDSLADGPVIQAAAARALEQKVTIIDIFDRIKLVIPTITTPIVIFTYYNLILSQGVEEFVVLVKSSGAKGLIVPDLPLEESEFLLKLCSEYSLELILLISPTSSVERIKMIASKAKGCIYIVAGTGVTGFRTTVNTDIKYLIDTVKTFTSKPIIIGFGISTPSQVALVKSWGVDGVVLGSAFVNKLSNFVPERTLLDFKFFCKEIKQALI
nr:trpA [Porphyropsis coccinea]